MKTKNLLFIALATVLSLGACKKSSNTPEAEANYAISITGTATPTTSYLLSTKIFPTGTVGTSSALESSSSAVIFKYGKNIYQNNFGAPATLTKYEFDDAGKPQSKGAFVIPGLKTIAAVSFVSETEAYATVAGFGSLPKLVKFNPTSMQVTSTLDITGLLKTGATEVYLDGLLQRGNYLYMGVTYVDKNFNSLEDKVFVAIFDITTGSFFKLISDSRSTQMWNGSSEAGFSPNVFKKEANGDIYLMGYADAGKPSGVLRIKNNETVIDPTYFFDLNAATGGPCFGLLNFGNTTVTVKFTSASDYPFGSKSVAEYHKIDLVNKITSGNIDASLPKFNGNKAFASKFDNDKIYFNVATATDNSIYSYQISNGAVIKSFDLTGACNGFTKLN